MFEILVVIGYGFGLYSKIWTWQQGHPLAWSTWFYIADIAMVCIDIVLYFRNTKLDRARDACQIARR